MEKKYYKKTWSQIRINQNAWTQICIYLKAWTQFRNSLCVIYP